MKFIKLLVIIGMFSGLCFASAPGLVGADTPAKSTLENLQAAFNGESNAKAKYDAFAAKADQEGYKSVAALFRAAAKSESIHANKHTAALKKLNAVPKATVENPEVKSTKENLEVALAGENYEKESMYPAFIKQAEAEQISGAVKSFKVAMETEIEHAKMFSQALKELDSWKESGKVFFVCQVCGFTTMDKIMKKCPICSAPRSKFFTIE